MRFLNLVSRATLVSWAERPTATSLGAGGGDVGAPVGFGAPGDALEQLSRLAAPALEELHNPQHDPLALGQQGPQQIQQAPRTGQLLGQGPRRPQHPITFAAICVALAPTPTWTWAVMRGVARPRSAAPAARHQAATRMAGTGYQLERLA